MIRVFVVKHEATGLFLPPLRTYTSATGRKLSDTPRIFYREQYARSAARWWAKGHAGWAYSQDLETGARVAEGIESRPVEGRQRGDLTIHEATLTIDGEEL